MDVELSVLQGWFENGVLINERMIYLENDSTGEDGYGRDNVTSIMASRFIKAISLLESISDKPITVILNTPGGDEGACYTTFDRIKESKCHITIRCYGQVMSAGSIILQAADQREITPNVLFMMHCGELSLVGKVTDLINWTKAYNQMESAMYKIYFDVMVKKNKKLTIKKVEDLLRAEQIIRADKIIELGLADTIYKGDN